MSMTVRQLQATRRLDRCEAICRTLLDRGIYPSGVEMHNYDPSLSVKGWLNWREKLIKSGRLELPDETEPSQPSPQPRMLSNAEIPARIEAMRRAKQEYLAANGRAEIPPRIVRTMDLDECDTPAAPGCCRD